MFLFVCLKEHLSFLTRFTFNPKERLKPGPGVCSQLKIDANKGNFINASENYDPETGLQLIDVRVLKYVPWNILVYVLSLN